jgi:succinate dehydrogenase / fumarate reductase membrane anchor subunit
MAVDAERPARPVPRDDGLRAGMARRAGRGRPGQGGEFWWWVFMRVSGILLLVLAVGHVLIMHVFGDGVDRVNFAFVALRWQSPFWRTWDWLMLSLALLHGVNGLRVISLDYIRRPGFRIAVNWGFNITGIVLFALGSIVVFTFDPSKWPGTGA